MAAALGEIKETSKDRDKTAGRRRTCIINHTEAHLIRPCTSYWKEFTSCCSSTSRMRQLYINGIETNCAPLKIIADKCYAMEKRGEEAEDFTNELITYEKERNAERDKLRSMNTVWEYRTSPPEDWSAPLPEFMEARKDTHLNKIQDTWEKEELRITVREYIMRDQMCSIS